MEPGALRTPRPYRRQGFTTEALVAVCTWLGRRDVCELHWECVAGNVASASVARAAGFRFTGTGPSRLTFRDGSHPDSWHATRREGEGPDGSSWPTETFA